jgi:hypothetical protein
MTAGPDFLCIGAPKAGTHWLYDQLAWHPDAWMPPFKELHVFDRPLMAARRGITTYARRIHNQGLEKLNAERAADLSPPLSERDVQFFECYGEKKKALDFEWYGKLFSAKGSLVSGELTPAYCALPRGMVQQIARKFPGLKIVFLIRDPVARAWSHLQMHKRLLDRRGPGLSLDDLATVRAYLQDPSVQLKSRPTVAMPRWREVFPEKQFHYEFFDNIVECPVEARRSILGFLGLDPARCSDRIPANFNRKFSQQKYELTGELKSLLGRLFAKNWRTVPRSSAGRRRVGEPCMPEGTVSGP